MLQKVVRFTQGLPIANVNHSQGHGDCGLTKQLGTIAYLGWCLELTITGIVVPSLW